MAYATMLEGEGRRREAMETVRPLVFREVASSYFPAVELYDRNVRIAKGPAAQALFHTRIQDRMLDGFTLRDYRRMGLTADQAMVYIRGGEAQGRGDFAGAWREYRKLVALRPPSMELYANVRNVLFALHRPKEVIPLFEDWYLHSDRSMRETIKARCRLDYVRLDRPLHS